MRIALIAHDKKKSEMLQLTKEYRDILNSQNLVATGTTGSLIKEKLGLNVQCYLSGPLGGDQQIGAETAGGQVDMVIFLRDPLTAQPHEPDISALIRICDVHNIPIATNVSTAKALLNGLA